MPTRIMVSELAIIGIFLIAVGIFAFSNPLSIRTFNKPKEFEENPERAEQKQEALAYLFAISCIMGGFLALMIGLFG